MAIAIIYITNKIYLGNPHFMLYQLVQKLNDLNLYIQFSNSIEFKIYFDSKNTSNPYKSHAKQLFLSSRKRSHK